MESSKISIVIPVFKTENYIRQCVDSILSQTYQDIEVILVDDESPDQCPQICDEYAAGDKRVMVIHKKNGGSSFAREIGIRHATGDYIMFVDSDDWIEADTLSICVKEIYRNNPDCVLFSYTKEYSISSIPCSLFGQSMYLDKKKAEEMVHRRIIGMYPSEMHHPEQIDIFSTVWGKLYRLEVAKRGRIVSERVVGTSEDTIFNIYALENCTVSYINQFLYHYRKSNAFSITAQYKPDLPQKWDNLYQIINEYINTSDMKSKYQSVLWNRIICGIIGLGLNEANGNNSIRDKANNIINILKKPYYIDAFRHLDTSYCDIKWKIFFYLCKKQCGILILVLLNIMALLRANYNPSKLFSFKQ